MTVNRHEDTWGGGHASRVTGPLFIVACLVAGFGCAPIDSTEAVWVETTPRSLSFGPCADCMEPAFGASQGGPPAQQRAIAVDFGLPHVGYVNGHHDAHNDGPPPIVQGGGGPVGMGPCADCLVVAVKLSDLGVHRDAIDHVEKAALSRRGVHGRELQPVEDPSPRWGHTTPDHGDPELWVSIPLERVKLDGLWQIESVRLTLRLDDAERIEASAPPQRTRVESSDVPPALPMP